MTPHTHTDEWNWRELAEITPDTIFRVTREGHIVGIKPGQDTGALITNPEQVGKSIHEAFPHHPTERILHEIHASLLGGQVRSIRYRCTDAEKDRQLEARIVPVASNDVLVILRDLTGEKALHNSQALLELMFKLIPSAVILVSMDGVIQDWNSASQGVFGYAPEEAIGNQLSQLIGVSSAVYEDLIKSPDGGSRSISAELGVQNRNGDRLEILLHAARVTSEDGPDTGILLLCQDLTAYKKAEALADNTRRQQQAILNNIPDIAWLKDTESTYVMVNEAFATACGMSVADLIGKDDRSVWPVEHANAYRADDREVMATRKRKRIDEPIKFADGTVFQIETIKTPIYGVDGQVIGTTGIARDITEKARALKELGDREALYRTLFESSFAGFLLIRKEQFIDCNDKISALLGYSREEILSKTIVDFSPSEQPDGKSSADAFAMRLSVSRTGMPQHFNWRLISRDGAKIEAEVNLKPIVLHDETLILIEIRDVTSRLQAELKLQDQLRFLQLLIDSIPTPIFYKDSAGAFVGCNRSFAEFFGKPRQDILGQKASSILSADEAEILSQYDQILLREGKSQFAEFSLNHADGSRHHVVLCQARFQNQAGLIGGIVGTMLDITHQKNYERKLRVSEERLQEAQEMGRIGHWSIDVESEATEWSDQMCHIFDRDKSEPPISFVNGAVKLFGEDGILLGQAMRSCITRGIPFSIDTQINLPGGEIKYLQIKARLNADPESGTNSVVGTVQDISEHKKTEIALRESQERFRIAIVHSGMIVSHQNRLLDYEWIYDPGTASGMSTASFDTLEKISDSKDEILELKKRVLASGVGERIEFKTSVENDLKAYDLIVEPRYDFQDRIIGLTNVAVDITARKQAERSLVESHRLLTALMVNLPGMIYRCRNDSERTLEFASDGCVGLTGYGAAVTGYPVHYQSGGRKLTFNDLIHPDDKEATNIQLKQSLEKSAQYELTYRIVTVSGEVKWVWEHGWAESGTAPEQAQLQGLLLDVTQQKVEDERRIKLNAAIEQAAEAIMITDITGKIEYVNPAFEEITGYSTEEVVGQSPQLMKSGQHQEAFYRNLWETILRGEVWKGRLINRRKDGALIEEDASIRAVRDAAGKIINFIAVKRDVTKFVALEAQLRQAQKLEAVGALAAGIAHEINTPIQFVGDNTHFLSESFSELLTLLDSASELAQHSDTDSCKLTCSQFASAMKKADLNYLRTEIPKAIEQSLQGIDRVANIVRAMKDFSHPDKREKTVVDINRALKTTLTVAHNELKYVADVEEDFAPDLPPLLCYPSELNQVFLNLFVNAAHAIADAISGTANRGKITVKSSLEGESLLIAISDSGSGIDQAVQDRVFEPFFTTKEVGKGTGQGLAIARSVVVEKHGGEIYFESKKGVGTTFYVKLPLQQHQEALT